MFDDPALRKIFKKRSDPGKSVGKENSSKKTVKESKSAETLVLKSPQKFFKQQKLAFAAQPVEAVEELDGNNSTFCETFAPSKLEKSDGPAARSTPQRKPFAFGKTKHPDLKQTAVTPDVPLIKKEKLSPDRFVGSDIDIFASDCEIIEVDDLPISIRESNESADRLAERLLAEVPVEVDEDEVHSSTRKVQKRTKFYGECRECIEVSVAEFNNWVFD